MSRAVALAAIGAVLLIAACGDEKAKPPVSGVKVSMADTAEQYMLQVRYNLADAGVSRGELLADTAYAFEDNSKYEFRRVRVEFRTPQGVKNGTMTSDRGTYSTRFGLVEGFGNVVVITEDGKKLTSPSLRYNQATNEIATDSAFVFEDAQSIQRGVGLRTDPKLSVIKVLSNWSGVVRKVPVPQGKP